MKKIMVVDDEEDVLETVAMVLNQNGFETITTDNGKKGISEAKKHKPNLILLDVMMPDMTGYEVVEKLSQHSSTKGIGIILLSAITATEDEKKKIKKGAVRDFIEKPFDIDDLVRRVNKAVR